MARNILLGILHRDEKSGVETFMLNAGLQTLTLNKRECKKAGFIFYHGECVGVPDSVITGEVKEEPVMISGRLMYYVYAKVVSKVNVGVV